MSNAQTSAKLAELAGRSRFLEAREPSVRQEIFEKAAEAARLLKVWADQYPQIRTVRAQPLALSVTAAAAFSEIEDIFDTARVSLWVFTLDDLFDESGLPTDDLLRLAESYRAIAHGYRGNRTSDPLALALLDARTGLERLPRFQELSEEWASALCRTIDGMIVEHQWQLAQRRDGVAGLPTYPAYVENGLNSIGRPPHVWSAIIATGDPSVAQHLPFLREMERLSSTCVRLANDLQSYSKELAEQTLNSLLIVEHAFSQSGLNPVEVHARAYRWIEAEIQRHLADLDRLQVYAQSKTGRPEAVTADIARFVCEFYSHFDYHTFTAQS